MYLCQGRVQETKVRGRSRQVEALSTAQDIAYDFQYNGLVEDLAEGDRVAAAMDRKRLLLHRNHGVILGVENMARVRY